MTGPIVTLTLTVKELERIPALFAQGLSTMQIRDVFRAERFAAGKAADVHEHQIYNAMTRLTRRRSEAA